MRLHDKDVRLSLYSEIKQHFVYDKTTHIVDELQICNGTARIDVAAINGSLHGYEIKSESDTLIRLPNQIEQYNKVFDYIYFVCSDNQYDKAISLVPSWWGIYVVVNINGEACIELVREPVRNESLDAFSLLQFLNKSELVDFGQMHNIAPEAKLRKMQKYRLWSEYAEIVGNDDIWLSELSKFLRSTIKSRESGRTRLLQM